MSQLQFWQKNFTYPANSYVLDGVGNIQFTSAGGLSGPVPPPWNSAHLGTTTESAESAESAGSPPLPLVWVNQGLGGKTPELQKPLAAAPYNETFVDAVSFSRGTADAGKYVLLDSFGTLDPSVGGGGGGGSAFSAITGGPANTGQSLVVGTGSSLTFSGGVIDASKWNGTPVTGSPTLGKIPIGQGTSAAWADPLVQGIQADDTSALTVNPVLVGGSDYSSPPLLHDIKVNASGQIEIGNTVTVTGTLSGGGGTQFADNAASGATPMGTLSMGWDSGNLKVRALKVDGTQNLNVNTQSAVYSASANGSTANPVNAVYLGASDGGITNQLQGLLVESSSQRNLRVSIFQGGGEANVTSNRLLVDASGTTITTTISGTAAVNVSQWGGSATTLGQKVSASSVPVVLASDQSRINTQDAAEANANGSTVVPTNALFMGAKGADGFLHALSSSTNDGKLDVNASFSGSVSTDFIVDRVQSGSITSTQTVVVNTKGAASVVFSITGTWTGAIQFQALMPDTTTWAAVLCYAKFPSGVAVSQTTINGQWALPVGGVNQFRVIGNTVGSGTAVANLEAGSGGLVFEVAQLTASNLNATITGAVTVTSGAITVSGTVTDNQGSAGTIGQSWFTKVTDGANVFGTTTAHPFLTQDISDGVPNTTSQPTTAIQAAGWDGGHLRVLSTDASGFLNVNASVSGSFTPALTSDRTVTGTITTTGTQTISTQGAGTLLFNISGGWSGTIVFEGSVDGTNWVAVKCVPKYPTGDLASQTTSQGQWALATGGLNSFRLRGATVSSTATVWLEAGAGAQDINVISTDINNFNATAQLTDGTNIVAVKAASTVPVAADKSLVVSISPNSAQFATSTTANALPGINPTTVGTGSVAVLSANPSRKEVIVTNTGTTILYLGLGQTPTNTSYHVALAKCTAGNDGTGSSWTSDMWKGAINIIGSGAGGTVNVAELT
jgi:hypothetical protein